MLTGVCPGACFAEATQEGAPAACEVWGVTGIHVLQAADSLGLCCAGIFGTVAVGAKHAVVLETIFAQMLCLPTCRSRLVAYGQLLVRVCLSSHLHPYCFKQVACGRLQSATACPELPGRLAVPRQQARR